MQQGRLSATFLTLSLFASAVIPAGASAPSPAEKEVFAISPIRRLAKRLERRLQSWSLFRPSTEQLASALWERRRLLQQSVTMEFTSPDGVRLPPVTIDPQKYPLLLGFESSFFSAHFFIDPQRIDELLTTEGFLPFSQPADATILEILDGKTKRAVMSKTAKSGYAFDEEGVVNSIVDAFYSGSRAILVSLTPSRGHIENATGQDLGPMELVAVGRSTFAGSGTGRIANVHKGLEDHLNNVLIAPGEHFSFNSILGRVTEENGWHQALVLFGGPAALAPGGGICQVSTTMYRAILNGGFQVLERKSHSAYVPYYEKHGVGIDATVYPGIQDLRFVNDTKGYLLVQAYSEGFEAYVQIYGTPVERTVQLEGPYFWGTAPKGYRNVGPNDIEWLRHITFADGTQKTDTILSHYKILPRRARTL
jgi:vancomycin resistance protein YoaR